METEIIILFAKKWQMTKERDGEDREGVTIQFVLANSLKPKVSAKDGSLGYVVGKGSISTQSAAVLDQVPGVYFAELGMKGKGELTVEDVLSFVSPIDK